MIIIALGFINVIAPFNTKKFLPKIIKTTQIDSFHYLAKQKKNKSMKEEKKTKSWWRKENIYC
jgi:hypothetical protein